MSYVKLSYVEFEFYSFTRYTDGMFQSKFPFKDNKYYLKYKDIKDGGQKQNKNKRMLDGGRG